MTTSRLSVIATVTCATAWTAKAVAIGTAGGLGRSPLESPLFLLGLAAFVVAVVSLCLTLTTGRTPGLRALAVLGGVVAGVGTSIVTGLLVGALQPADPSWVWAEVNLWVAAAVLLPLALGPGRRDRARRGTHDRMTQRIA